MRFTIDAFDREVQELDDVELWIHTCWDPQPHPEDVAGEIRRALTYTPLPVRQPWARR